MFAVENYDHTRFADDMTAAIAFFKEGCQKLGSVPMIILTAFRLNRMNRIALHHFRAVMSICGDICERAECVGKIYALVKTVRDRYSEWADVALRLPCLFFFRKQTEYILSEWDNLAEDCAIASDPGFRQLVFRIAEKI